MNPALFSYKTQLKAEMRKRMFQLRRRMAPMERRRAHEVIQREILYRLQPEWKTVLIYLSMSEEVETGKLIREFLRRGLRVCVPAFDYAKGRYFPAPLKNPDTDLVPGKLGILEPIKSNFVETLRLDVIFVPGLAFDRQGHRLGFGKGYFDRICAAARALKIALAYHFQIVNAVESRQHDVPMDLIFTEKETIRCQKS